MTDPSPAGTPASATAIRPTTLALVRHAVTAQTGPLLTGRAPGVDLSEEGRSQAKALAVRLADASIDAIYSSPIERTAQTAALIAEPHGLEVHVLEGVIEADYGDWTGGALADLAKTDVWKVVQRTPSLARFPGGESIAGMQARVVAALDEVIDRHRGERIVVVSHADPIKSAVAHYTGMHLDLFQRIHIGPASVSVIDFHPHGPVLVKSNETGALDELRAGDDAREERP